MTAPINDLVAVAIHDAKNALNVLNVCLAEAGKQAPSEALDQAKAIAGRLSAQLVELLALYRADSNSLRLAVEDHNLEDFLAEVMADLATPPDCTIAVERDFRTARSLGEWAFDAYLLKFILLDALRNALRHANSRVTFTLTAEPGGGLRFTVTDDGPGFPQEILAGESRTAECRIERTGAGLRAPRRRAPCDALGAPRPDRVEPPATDATGNGWVDLWCGDTESSADGLGEFFLGSTEGCTDFND